MPYTATNDVSAMDAAKPLGSEPPDILDEALRETRLVLSNVIQQALTATGKLKIASWVETHTATAIDVGAATRWERRHSTAVEYDPQAILAAGAHTQSILPVSGTYLVVFGAVGYRVGDFAVRLASTNSNTTAPSDSTEVIHGSVARSTNATADAATWALGFGTFTANGTTSYCLDTYSQTNDANSKWSMDNTNVGGGTGQSAFIVFIRLGA